MSPSAGGGGGAAAAATTVAEDCGLLAVDCVVVCCCCPCLLLQITVFLFVRLPRRIAVKSKRVVLRKLQKRLKKGGGIKDVKVVGASERVQLVAGGGGCELLEGHCWIAAATATATAGGGGGSFVEAEKVLQELMDQGGRRSCFEEAEEVLKLELAMEQGLLWFGSFWGIDG